jgi:hypothetical protein
MNRRIVQVCFLFFAFLVFGATSSVLAPSAQAQFVSVTQAAQQHAVAEPTFTYIADCPWGTTESSGTTVSCSFSSAPAAGDAVVCTVAQGFSSTATATMVDGAGNNYVLTSHSPNLSPDGFRIYQFYLVNTPAGSGSQTVTATFNQTITFSSNMTCDEFHRSSGTWVPDTSASASSGTATTSITGPTITPANTGELLVGIGSGTSTGGINAVTGSWTASSAGKYPGAEYTEAEYILSASSGGTAVGFTLNASTTWNALALALK